MSKPYQVLPPTAPVPAPDDVLELVCYPNLTRGCRGIPEAYTWFTLIPWLEGDVEVISRGMRAPCESGSVTVGEPGEPYALRPRSHMRGEFRVLRVDNSLLDSIIQEIGMRSNLFPREPVVQHEVAELFGRCYDAIASGELLATQERLLSLMAILVGGRRCLLALVAGQAPVVPFTVPASCCNRTSTCRSLWTSAQWRPARTNSPCCARFQNSSA